MQKILQASLLIALLGFTSCAKMPFIGHKFCDKKCKMHKKKMMKKKGMMKKRHHRY